jgi:hypothetical protein
MSRLKHLYSVGGRDSVQPPCRELTARGVETTRLRMCHGLCVHAKQRMRRIDERIGHSPSKVPRLEPVKALQRASAGIASHYGSLARRHHIGACLSASPRDGQYCP